MCILFFTEFYLSLIAGQFIGKQKAGTPLFGCTFPVASRPRTASFSPGYATLGVNKTADDENHRYAVEWIAPGTIQRDPGGYAVAGSVSGSSTDIRWARACVPVGSPACTNTELYARCLARGL